VAIFTLDARALRISENGISGVLMGTFWWNKFAKLGYINLSNRRHKTVTYGLWEKSVDSDADLDSITTLVKYCQKIIEKVSLIPILIPHIESVADNCISTQKSIVDTIGSNTETSTLTALCVCMCV